MFTRNKNPNLIESDEGFSVEVLGRAGLRYREGDRSAFIDSEVLTRGICFYPNSIKNWENSNLPVTALEKERMIDNIIRAIESTGEPAEVWP